MVNIGKILTKDEFIEKWCDAHPFQGTPKPNQTPEEYLSESLAHEIDQRILAELFWNNRNLFREQKLKRLLGE